MQSLLLVLLLLTACQTDETVPVTGTLSFDFTSLVEGTHETSAGDVVDIASLSIHLEMSDPEYELTLTRIPWSVGVRNAEDDPEEFDTLEVESWVGPCTFREETANQGDSIVFHDELPLAIGVSEEHVLSCALGTTEYHAHYELAVDLAAYNQYLYTITTIRDGEVVDVTDEVDIRIDMGRHNGLPYPSHRIALPYNTDCDLPVEILTTDDTPVGSVGRGLEPIHEFTISTNPCFPAVIHGFWHDFNVVDNDFLDWGAFSSYRITEGNFQRVAEGFIDLEGFEPRTFVPDGIAMEAATSRTFSLSIDTFSAGGSGHDGLTSEILAIDWQDHLGNNWWEDSGYRGAVAQGETLTISAR